MPPASIWAEVPWPSPYLQFVFPWRAIFCEPLHGGQAPTFTCADCLLLTSPEFPPPPHINREGESSVLFACVFQETKREADWFRIGFEPLFVDLSKSGCSYLIFLLLKVYLQHLLSLSDVVIASPTGKRRLPRFHFQSAKGTSVRLQHAYIPSKKKYSCNIGVRSGVRTPDIFTSVQPLHRSIYQLS